MRRLGARRVAAPRRLARAALWAFLVVCALRAITFRPMLQAILDMVPAGIREAAQLPGRITRTEYKLTVRTAVR